MCLTGKELNEWQFIWPNTKQTTNRHKYVAMTTQRPTDVRSAICNNANSAIYAHMLLFSISMSWNWLDIHDMRRDETACKSKQNNQEEDEDKHPIQAPQ